MVRDFRPLLLDRRLLERDLLDREPDLRLLEVLGLLLFLVFLSGLGETDFSFTGDPSPSTLTFAEGDPDLAFFSDGDLDLLFLPLLLDLLLLFFSLLLDLECLRDFPPLFRLLLLDLLFFRSLDFDLLLCLRGDLDLFFDRDLDLFLDLDPLDREPLDRDLLLERDLVLLL